MSLMWGTTYFRFAKEFLGAEWGLDPDAVSDQEAQALAKRWRRQWLAEIAVLGLYFACAWGNRHIADVFFLLVATIVPYYCFLAMRASENLRPGWMLKMKRVMAARWQVPVEQIGDAEVSRYSREEWKEMLLLALAISLVYVSVNLFKRHFLFDFIALLLLLMIGSGAQLMLMPWQRKEHRARS